MKPVCNECEYNPIARGLCKLHYDRAWKAKEFVPHRRTSAEDFFRAHYTIAPSGCWEWTAAKLKTGYGALHDDMGTIVRAHRFAYQLLKGPITRGRFVLHSCDNRLCVNPDHLRLGTQTDNMQEASERNRIPQGERHHQAKLTESQVLEIRSLARTMKQKDIAKQFHISRAIVCQIISRQIWKHLP
jgi:HNH endonuclease